MKKLILLVAFLLVGCGVNLNKIPEQEKTSIQQIPRVENLTWEKVEVPPKPEITVKKFEDKKLATLDNKGMADLIKLYSGAKNRTEEVNSLVVVLNKTIDERNKLLDLAKSEELRSNALAKDLSAEREARIADQKAADLQLTITRLIALIAIGFAI
ncbi:putative membrane protein [Dickeya phage vB_DsoM_JA33]|uniref:Putative membrane protein n=2 Tax=Salmondvirus JA11 TaxID=2734141 RepID=A0A386K6A2_9CAUD|nr:lipoprotein [Dickeya phage vB_DsoM_JA11]AXG67442.1 putative membrane protein [Dickeya phage vB_DsoM_JA33]AYD79873.1 putative membrane protein [Dickeya phage vB_DsoM_JA11]